MADIKSLLNDIIHDTDTSYPDAKTDENYNKDAAFDKEAFREKLSLNVLKDIIGAMMHDETKDLDGMIDASIMNHINTNYSGSCYNYLTKSNAALNSPMLGSIIQEINDKVEEAANVVCCTKNTDYVKEADLRTKEMLDSCDEGETYKEFCNRLRDKVAKDIVEDVSRAIADKNVPVFDDLDSKIKQSDEKKDDPNKNAAEVETTANESMIMTMCGNIVQESVLNNKPMTTEQGLNKAIIEYCIVQMDILFKQNKNIDGFSRYLK